MDAHYRFIISSAVALATATLLYGHVWLSTLVVACWDVFALTTLGLVWMVLSTQDPYESRRSARLQDSSRTFLFILVVFAASASVVAVGLLLGSAKGLPKSDFAGHVALSVAAVFLSWMLVHSLFAIRYAHFYYYDAIKVKREHVAGGLIFPGKDTPGYIDFAYFSFVIGMTSQVSDVQISSQQLRRLALVHGVISFAFNTAILAMFVNIVAGLI